MPSRFRLAGPVGANTKVGRDDALRTKDALRRLGYYAPDSGIIDHIADGAMLDGLRAFQKDNGLAANGMAKPGDATERLLSATLFEADNRSSGNMASGFAVAAPVGTGGANHPADVATTKRALAVLDIIPPEEAETAMAERTFSGAIEAFQRLFNLHRDGKINPGGETERALARVVRAGGSGVASDSQSRPQLALTDETPERIYQDLGGNPHDLAVPYEPYEQSKGSRDSPERPRSSVEFRQYPEAGGAPFFDSGKRAYKTFGPIKVERWSDAMGADGIRYRVRWYPLDSKGKVDQSVQLPENVRREYGGHVGATGVAKGLFGIDPPNDIIHPPFEHPNGWRVEVEVPPQPSVHDNTAGAYLRVYLPKGKNE